MSRRAFLAALGAGGLACASAAPTQTPPRARPGLPSQLRVLDLPTRPAGAASGSEFVEICERLGPADRETAIIREILAGNVPSFLRTMARVQVTGSGPDTPNGAVWVTPDYLAVGSDHDFVRTPMAKAAAHEIARALKCVLPTSRIVDAIYAAATCKLTSPAHGASAIMATTQLYAAHNREIEARRAAARCEPSALVAGPKKDLVISRREAEKPGRLVIYGWFNEDGTVIQPLSLLHSEKYVDFSHGVRLVSDEMDVAGTLRNIFEVLRDQKLSGLVSNEGSFAPFEAFKP